MTLFCEQVLANRNGDSNESPARVSEQHRILVAVPGPSIHPGAIAGFLQATRKHQSKGWFRDGNDNFQYFLCAALNMFEAGLITHAAMLHADMKPDPWWIDTIVDEMDRLDAGLISAPAVIGDERKLLSFGVAEPKQFWHALRRFTLAELPSLPDTFNAADLGYPDCALLHNNGCFVMDLRKPQFFATDPDGQLLPIFMYPKRIRRDPETGRWMPEGCSEDYYFSRIIHQLGIRSWITKKVVTGHLKARWHRTDEDGGTWSNDEESRALWQAYGEAKKQGDGFLRECQANEAEMEFAKGGT